MESSETSTPPTQEKHTHALQKHKSKNHPRRFSDEQIRSLESIFKHQQKLDPRTKLQIATDLCLHPQQVAIWFQNKRARWKSKQLYHDFTLLKSNYQALSIKFDDLKREKHSLQMQLQELNGRLKKNGDEYRVDDAMASGDDGRNFITSNYLRKGEDDNNINQEFMRWGGEEEEPEEEDMNQAWHKLSSSCTVFDESSHFPNWLE